jgi:mannosyl-oligosaccharide glucosidase
VPNTPQIAPARSFGKLKSTTRSRWVEVDAYLVIRERLSSTQHMRRLASLPRCFLVWILLVASYGGLQLDSAVWATSHASSAAKHGGVRTGATIQGELSLDPQVMGSLVPGVFAGYRRPVPNSPTLGVMWFPADDALGFTRLRQHCTASLDGSFPLHYGWLQHNGRDYGVRFVQERGWNMTIAHLAHTESLDLASDPVSAQEESSAFTFRIRASGDEKHNVSLFIYWAAQRDEIDPNDLGPSSTATIQPPVFDDCGKLSVKEGSQGHIHFQCASGRPHWRIIPVSGFAERSKSRRTRHRPRRRSSTAKSTIASILREHTNLGRIHLRRDQISIGSPSEVKSVVESWLGESHHRLLDRLRTAYEQERMERSSLNSASDSFDGFVERWLRSPAGLLPTIASAASGDSDNNNNHEQESHDQDAQSHRQADSDWQMDGENGPKGNLVVAQFTLQTPFELIVTSSEHADATAFASMLARAERRFTEQFQQAFPRVHAGEYNARQIAQAQQALAGLLGGISYFYGSLVVEQNQTGAESGQLAITKPFALVSAVPSEDKFPRGFFWDEGFHQLLIQRWDAELSLICLHSWLELTMQSGWIPRELAPGIEARSRFPKELTRLLVQSERVANPPTMLIPLHRHWRMLQKAFPLMELDVLSSLCAQGGDDALLDYTSMLLDQSMSNCSVVNRAADTARHLTRLTLHKMGRYLLWLNETQANYAWHGRHLTTLRTKDGNYPTTLASGFDDFPRAPIPSANEAHVDLLSWILYGIGRLADFRSQNKRADEALDGTDQELSRLEESLQRRLFGLHWNFTAGMFCDVGAIESTTSAEIGSWRHYCHLGYPTLLPLSLGLLPVNATQTGVLLEAAADPRQLSSPFGLRSLSAADPYYMRGDRYWTGPIWVPMNYLTLAALKEKYARRSGPFQKTALDLYEHMRHAMVQTVLQEHDRTGFFWEHYDPQTGHGGGGHPFTGWTGLVLLIMEEDYDGIIDSDASIPERSGR